MEKRVTNLFALLLALSSSACLAGTFVVRDVWYNFYPPGTNSVRAWVAALAEYVGTPDVNDQESIFQTTACEITLGGALNCNEGTGLGANVPGPYSTGQTLICNTVGCMGNRFVVRPCCPSSDPNFQGRGGVAIYHPFSPEIHTLWGFPSAVSCKNCGGGGGGTCGSAVAGAGVVLPIRGREPALAEHADLLAASFLLDRTERQGGVNYLMEEWAVLTGHADGSAPTGAAASSAELAAILIPRVSAAHTAALRGPASGTGDPWQALVVMAPPHPKNHRWIPTPRPRLRVSSVEQAAGWGTLVVRADFSEDRQLQRFDVLVQEGAIGPAEVALLRESLYLEFQGEERHRVVLFAVVRVGAEVTIESSATVLPLCCPGDDGPPFPV
jgi:hypothetical protein